MDIALDQVFPAYAGMNLAVVAGRGLVARVPRVRGDEPNSDLPEPCTSECSPRTRG